MALKYWELIADKLSKAGCSARYRVYDEAGNSPSSTMHSRIKESQDKIRRTDKSQGSLKTRAARAKRIPDKPKSASLIPIPDISEFERRDILRLAIRAGIPQIALSFS